MPCLFLKHLPWSGLRLLGFFLFTLGSGLAQGQSLLTLYDVARGHDAAYRAALAETDAAAARTGQARAPLLPQLQLQAEAAHLRSDHRIPGFSEGSSTNTRSVTLAGVQAIYHPRERITWEQSKKATQTSQIALLATQQDLMIRVAGAYFDVLAAQSALASAQALKEAITRQRQLARRNFDIGNATITDYAEAQARLDAVRAQEIAAENELRVSQLVLQNLVGQAGVAPWPLAEPLRLPPLQPATLSQWEALAEAGNAQIRQHQVALQIAELDTRKARAGHLPQVDLQLSASATQTNGDALQAALMGGGRNARIAVQLTLPLFSGLGTHYQVRESLAEQDKVRAQLAGSRRDAATAVQTAFFGAQSTQARVAALQSALQSAQKALQANERGYEVGVRINIDVLNAQAQVHDIQNQLMQARFDALLAQLRLKQLAGTLSEVDLAQIDALLQAPVALTTAK